MTVMAKVQQKEDISANRCWTQNLLIIDVFCLFK